MRARRKARVRAVAADLGRWQACRVIICAAGDIHGALERLYDDVFAFESNLGVQFPWILHVGDFGIWPDPDRIDKATRRHDGAGDFPWWAAEKKPAPRRTLFIKGNHEDFSWLDSRARAEVHPNLFYLRNGSTFDLRDDEGGALRVGGIGGCFGASKYHRPSVDLPGYGKRHYTRDEVERLGTEDRLDIVLTHDAPAGIRFESHRQGANWVSDAAGLDDLLERTKPLVCFFGHHHTRVDGVVRGVRCIGLNKVGHPRNLVALDVNTNERNFEVLGEWPGPSA